MDARSVFSAFSALSARIANICMNATAKIEPAQGEETVLKGIVPAAESSPFWGVLANWHWMSVKYADIRDYTDAPWFHGKRAAISLFASAAWQSSGIAIEQGRAAKKQPHPEPQAIEPVLGNGTPTETVSLELNPVEPNYVEPNQVERNSVDPSPADVLPADVMPAEPGNGTPKVNGAKKSGSRYDFHLRLDDVNYICDARRISVALKEIIAEGMEKIHQSLASSCKAAEGIELKPDQKPLGIVFATFQYPRSKAEGCDILRLPAIRQAVVQWHHHLKAAAAEQFTAAAWYFPLHALEALHDARMFYPGCAVFIKECQPAG
jgi:hypothetical protein